MKSAAQIGFEVDLHKTVLLYCVVDGNGDVVNGQRVAIISDAAVAAVFDASAPWQPGCRAADEAAPDGY